MLLPQNTPDMTGRQACWFDSPAAQASPAQPANRSPLLLCLQYNPALFQLSLQVCTATLPSPQPLLLLGQQGVQLRLQGRLLGCQGSFTGRQHIRGCLNAQGGGKGHQRRGQAGPFVGKQSGHTRQRALWHVLRRHLCQGCAVACLMGWLRPNNPPHLLPLLPFCLFICHLGEQKLPLLCEA